MAFFELPTTQEEHIQVAKAIVQLTKVPHITFMSRAMLANESGIKDTKLRAVLQDMINNKEIEQYVVSSNPQRQRYFFVLTEKGRELLGYNGEV